MSARCCRLPLQLMARIVRRRIGKRLTAYLEHAVRFGGSPRQLSVYLGPLPMSDRLLRRAAVAAAPRLAEHWISSFAESVAPRWKTEHLRADETVALEQLRAAHQLALRFLAGDEVRRSETQRFGDYAHGSTGIEGNPLNRAEVGDVLERGITPAGKTLREIQEVANFAALRDYVDSSRARLTPRLILGLHRVTMQSILTDQLGSLRRIPMGIQGVDVDLSPWPAIPDELRDLCRWADAQQGIRHPLELAALFHQRFEEIHPFIDGNGRVGREASNVILRRWGLPRIIFPKDRRREYMDALGDGNRGRRRPLVSFLASCLAQSVLAGSWDALVKVAGRDTVEIERRADGNLRPPRLPIPRKRGKLVDPP